MSSRETFVTNYLYNEDAAKAVAVALEPYAWTVVNHGRYVSGMIKGGWWRYYEILAACVDALRAMEYGDFMLERFEFVLIGDDVHGVLTRADHWGTDDPADTEDPMLAAVNAGTSWQAMRRKPGLKAWFDRTFRNIDSWEQA